jgi:DNA-directed RNA polymerase specialized sigma24 family protein
VDTPKAVLVEIDWGAVYKRLTVFALRLAHAVPEVFDGVSPEDLVGETMVAYFTGEGGMKWDSVQGSLERFLGGVLRNKFLLHARKLRRYGGSLDDARFAPEPNASIGKPLTATITKQIEVAAKGDTDLEELIKATQTLDSAANVNQQLSQILDTTIEDVVNRRKRLTRRVDRSVRLDYERPRDDAEATS